MTGDLVLRDARLWTHPDAAIASPQDVLLRAGRISRIGPEAGRRAAPGAEALDLDGRVVTAGFWNCHVHLTEPVWSRAHGAAAVQGALDDMLLSRGFTTAVDLGSRPRVTAGLMHRIEQGRLRGPRVLTAGAGLYPWRGLPFYLREQIPWVLRWALPTPLTAAGARRTVRAQARSGAGVIKLFTGSHITPQTVKPMRAAIARAATEEAHRLGLRVFTHPADREGTAVGLAAGVDALAHVPDQTEGVAPLLEAAARSGTHLVPTLHMYAATVSTDEHYLRPLRDALRGFREVGGQVLFGTEVGYLAERDTRPEFEAMAASGMSVTEILHSLTTAPAAFFGSHRAGTVEPGHPADLTVLETISTEPGPGDLADVHAVLRAGRLMWNAPRI